MIQRSFLIVLVEVVALFAPALRAQPAAPGAGRGQAAALLSPEVLADNRVTFRLSAPKASEVILNGDWTGGEQVAMTKNDQGVWSVTVGPLKPEMWGYTFTVDGVRALDPRNAITKRDGTRVENMLMVPGSESDLYQAKDVPHGDVSLVWYNSPSLKLNRRMYVYTPPSYRTSSERFPVLYLLHGGGGDEDQWFTLGRASQILDNLIAQGKAKPMLIVMPNGNANQSAVAGFGPAPSRPAPVIALRPGGSPSSGPAFSPDQPYADSIVTDIIPWVEKNYRVLTDANNRAIAGLSMGGLHTMAAAFPHPEMFAYIGLFSTGYGPQDSEKVEKHFAGFFNRGEAINKMVKLLWLGAGTEDGAHPNTAANMVLLKKHGIKFEYTETPGGHTWFNWRIYLSQFAPRLFR